MINVTENVSEETGYNLHVIPNKKHKTIAITAKFKAPLKRETITRRALLPYVLQQGTKSFPSSASLQARLNHLYGAVLSIDSAKKGNSHIISMRLEVANDKFVQGETAVLSDAVDLLNEVIFHANTDNQTFDSKIITREKETLKQKIHAIADDKMSYANMRLIDEMCAEEIYRLHVQGYVEDLPGITGENMYTCYQSLLEEDQLDIYVAGDVRTEDIQKLISGTINRTSHTFSKEMDNPIKEDNKKVNTVIEKQALKQAKLHLGYRTHITYNDDDYFALQVFNGIFGGFPGSKLFINVREKNSLAYYASSRVESHKGLLFVFSGIAPNDYEKAKAIILQQMTAMQKGEFTEQEMEETKGLIINQLLETMDHPQGLIEMFYQRIVAESTRTPEQLMEKIKDVTKDEVAAVANKIALDTIYLLTEDEVDANA